MRRKIGAFAFPDNLFFRGAANPSLLALRKSLLNLTVGNLSTVATRYFTESTTKMDLPIGYDNFRDVIENKLDFVDKSLFIKEIIDDNTKAAVITRPRRFGKTLNLSMLHCFLSPTALGGQPTQGLFDRLKIAALGEAYMQHQGKYPVVFVSFKDVKDSRYEIAYKKMCALIKEVYQEHRYLLTSPNLYDEDKREYQMILQGKPLDEAVLSGSLKNLTKYLYQHHRVHPWLLMDEYDTPIQAAYVNGYYDQMVNLLRGSFGAVLKTNPYLHKAVITGILRIAKESLFSGVNNLEIYSLLRLEYGQHFGFTEEEMDQLLEQAQLKEQAREIKTWYNGYQAGNTIVYNPWSVVNCIKQKGKLSSYWINTSDNQLIRDILVKSSIDFRGQFEFLLQGKPVEKLIDEGMVFSDIFKDELYTWTLLFSAGYLKVISQRETDQGLICLLDIPNREVRNLYRQIIERWLSNGYGVQWYNNFLNHLLNGNLNAFEEDLRHVMERTVSVHDTSHDPEAFYHGLMVGVTANLYQSKIYEISSNRESGYGRYDYMILSRDQDKPTLLLEFKRVEPEKDLELLSKKLKQSAQKAVEQIGKTRYLTEAERRGCTYILKIGIAFCGKRFKIEAEPQIGKELTKEFPSNP